MSKLARKFLLSLSAILLVVTLFSLYLNSNFIQRFFLYKEKQDLSRVSNELIDSHSEEAIARLEAENDVIIVELQYTDDNSQMNGRLRDAFLGKGVSLGGYGSFWLWEQDQLDAVADGSKLRIYQQEKLHYSFMVQYLSMGDSFVAIAKIIPAMARTISLINTVTACVFLAAALIMLLLVFFLVRRITNPLIRIGETAKAIANLNFKTVDIRTGDELELLAEDINDMSGKLEAAHRELEAKNRQMESLLANVSHDLKTPVSLIKAYASGIKDEVDDGTFLDTIILQNGKMEQMIERLLDLAKLQQQELPTEPVNLSILLSDGVARYRLQGAERGLSFQCRVEDNIVLVTERAAVETIFENMLSNAVKYADGDTVFVSLYRQTDAVLFEMQNSVAAEAEIDARRLWEPFYVAEQSRNKSMSGTGLGLSIVRTAAQKYGYDCTCELDDKAIHFTVKFK